MKIAIMILLAFFIAAGMLLHLLDKESQQAQQWVNYSEQHHCKIIREPDFRDESTLWQCDGGYEVER